MRMSFVHLKIADDYDSLRNINKELLSWTRFELYRPSLTLCTIKHYKFIRFSAKLRDELQYFRSSYSMLKTF